MNIQTFSHSVVTTLSIKGVTIAKNIIILNIPPTNVRYTLSL